MSIERRFTNELRAESQGEEMVLVGYASVFGKPSEDLGGFRETVMPGAFARSIREGSDVKFLMNHSSNLIMGRVKNGTLKLEEDGRGLRFRVKLPNTQAARDLHELVKSGTMDECSFAFTAKSQSWEDARSENGDLYANRKLMDVDLLDVSAVTYPAYLGTQVSAARALFPEGEPMELRSSIQALVEKRGSEAQPPDPSAISLPQPFDPDAKEEWYDAFAEAYNRLMKKGGRGYAVKQAIALAQAAANQAVQPATEVPPTVKGDKGPDRTKLPHEVVDTDGDDDADKYGRSVKLAVEKRVYKSVSEVPDYVPDAQRKQWLEVWNSAYKKAKKDGKSGAKAEASAFAQANAVAGPNAKRDDADDGKKMMKLIEKLAKSEEDAVALYTAAIDECKTAGDAECAATCQAILEDEQDHLAALTEMMGAGDDAEGRSKKVKDETRDHVDDVSDPDSPDYDPDDPDYDPDWESDTEDGDDEDKNGEDRKKVKKGEGAKSGASEKGMDDDADNTDNNADRAGKKTCKVAGKDLTADKFAYVGDPQDTSTWKLPVHDEAHARNALARYGQTKGIPADQKEKVWRRIVAAAKKFGIEVSEESSLRAAMPHAVTLAVLDELAWDQVAEELAARVRLIEIDLE